MQGTESDELGVQPGGAPAPVVPLQVLQQRNALFEPFQIRTHGVYRPSSVRVRTCNSRSQARMVGVKDGGGEGRKKSRRSQRRRGQGQKTRRKQNTVGQDKRNEP